jgi:hypothetical protein
MIRWSEETNLYLFTIDEFNQLPDGIELESIMGDKAVKGKDYIDTDTRSGYIAFGVRDPINHLEAELFTKFKLQR